MSLQSLRDFLGQVVIWRRELVESIKKSLEENQYPQLSKEKSFLRLMRRAVGLFRPQSNLVRLEIPREISERDFYISVFVREKTPLPIQPVYLSSETESIAIVVQGPIETRDDFTLTTVRSYREWFPRAPVIVSTWDDQDQKVISALRHTGATILTSPLAQVFPGVSNQNRQMVSTKLGLEFAREARSKYVVKTRADQRINNRFAVLSLPRLLESYPLLGKGSQQSRLVIPSCGTFAFRPYSASDFLMFGKIEDVLNYWNGFIDLRKKVNPNSSSFRDFSKTRVAEVAFFANYLESQGEHLDFTLRQYWKALGERFLVLDQAFLDLHWPKYSTVENRWGLWQGSPRFLEVSFAMWLLMLTGEIEAVEDFADEKF